MSKKPLFGLIAIWCCIPLLLLSAEESNQTAVPEIKEKVVALKGNQVFDSNDIYDALSVEHASWFAFWKDDTPKVKERLIPTFSDALRNFFDSEGYYDANFTIVEKPDQVVVDVQEGEPVRVAEINITSDYDLSEVVKFQKGEVFTAKKFIQTKADIISLMLEEGYCSYQLDSKAYVDLDKHTVEIRYLLQKGGVCTFGNATVSGLEDIDQRVVLSRVRAKPGSRFSTKAVRETSAALYGLQAFDSVLINVDRKFYNVVPVDITLQQMRDPYHIEAGVGYDTYVGPRAHVKFTKHDFLGNAQLLSLSLSWSQLENLIELDFYKPAFTYFHEYVADLGVSVGYSDLEFDGFREKRTWLKSFLRYEDSHLRLTAGAAVESITISKNDDECILPCYAYNTFSLAYPYVEAIYDARDSKLNPTKGYYLMGYMEMGLPWDSDSSLYLKTILEARKIYTVNDFTMAVVGKIGTIDLDGSNYGIPESKKFFGGGSYSNRAYGYKEIGVTTSPSTDLINGALSMANLSFEVDYPIYGKLYGALFNDNTLLNADSYDFTGEIISSAGVGVRYQTPVGPFKLDVGFNIDEPSIYGISFQIGQSF